MTGPVLDAALLESILSPSGMVPTLRGFGLQNDFEQSPEGIRARKVRTTWRTVALFMFGVGAALSILGWLVLGWSGRANAASALIGVLLAVTLFLASRAKYVTSFRSFVPVAARERQQKFEEEQQRLARDTTLPALLTFNREQIVRYHQVATTQARVAALNSQVAMMAGFVALVAGAAVAITANDATTKAVVGGLAGLGGALSGYIARTFLVAQDKAIAQLYQYWEQPLASSYFLTAERIVHGCFEDAATRDRELSKLVDQLLAAAASRDSRAPIAIPKSKARFRPSGADDESMPFPGEHEDQR